MIRRVFILFGLLALTACETIEGAGRDMQTAGQAVTQEARRTQAGM